MAATDTTPTPEFVPNGDRARDDRRLFDRFVDARDPLDRDAIVERFMPLARQIAARYQRPEEPFDDVFQVACYGLVKAVDRFDVERGVAFSSYAVPTITGEIKRHFRDRAWAVRVPRDLQELALRVERVGAELTRDLGRAPSVDEVAGARPRRGRERARGDGGGDGLPRDVARHPAPERRRGARRVARRHDRPHRGRLRPRRAARRCSRTSCAR